MNYNFEETRFPSADGKSSVYAEIYTPENCSPIGIVQIAHGMIDHIGRYRDLADHLTGEGFIVAGNHHLGHGKTAATPDDFGFFASRGGRELVLEDMHSMNRILRDRYPELPLVLFGHSMGSFLSRLYAVKYPNTIAGLVIHGTAGPNGAVGMGKLVARLICKIKGERHRSNLLASLSVGAYSKKFKADGPWGWLTRDSSMIADRATDPYTFNFTASAYYDLFTMLDGCNRRSWYKSFPKELPTLVMSGDADPVGNCGRGPVHVYKNLLLAGVDDVSIKMYEGARHELFKETNRAEMFCDLTDWLKRVAAKSSISFEVKNEDQRA